MGFILHKFAYAISTHVRKNYLKLKKLISSKLKVNYRKMAPKKMSEAQRAASLARVESIRGMFINSKLSLYFLF